MRPEDKFTNRSFYLRMIWPDNWVARIVLLACVAFVGTVLMLKVIIPSYRLSCYSPQEGDILFQSLPRNPLVDAIEGVSNSPYSHCGMVVRENGKWWVIEAIGNVHRTPLRVWTFRGRGFGQFHVYRLKTPFNKQIPDLIKAADAYLDRPYDIKYEMDDDKIYCSELIYKAYRDVTGQGLGKLKRLGELNWRPYQALIKRIENSDKVPVDREMITPYHLAKAEELEYLDSY